jgi:hypothetical protein
VFGTTLKTLAFSIAACVAASNLAFAQARLKAGASPSPPGAAVYFTDIKDGATLPAKVTIRFGVRGMELAPAGHPKPNSGHHHLLIDAELPSMDEPIPNDFNHLHFGNAQTEAEVRLTPGEHTLQLLLGDENHIPHSPPVMSERVRVRVVDGAPAPVADSAAAAPSSTQTPSPTQTPSARHPAPANAKVYFVYPPDGAVISTTPTIRFGLTNMGVAPAGVEKANTGHHHLLIDAPLPLLDQPIPLDFNHLHFGAGQTEAQITLTPGVHTLQLILGDENHLPHDPAVYSKVIKVTVSANASAEAATAAPRQTDSAKPQKRARTYERPRRQARSRAPRYNNYYGRDEE